MKYIPFFGCMMTIKYPQFEAAVRKSMAKVGVEFVDVDGFTCCPDPIYFQANNKLEWYIIAARNISLAEDLGHDIVTTCSGCTATLSEVNLALKEDDGLREQVNKQLKKIGREFNGSVNVRHAVTVLRDDFGMDKVAGSVVRPMEGLKVAIHYGCHLLKPSRVMKVDDPDHPTILENLVRTIGAEPIHHDRTLLCCGKACFTETIPDQMVMDILDSVQGQGADCLGLICPTCFDSFDVKQIVLDRKYKRKFEVPIIYYFQLLGLAQGYSPAEMGFHMHKIKTDQLFKSLAAAS
ncbi:MAG: CoB--CoM heterodisulfide reductase subunit B [candidate division Zixibacteria bacterium]|nr:CoB--CoM heterodisulfide reductase subunit B [candidate division Zixibacteria bacterium]